MQNAARPNDLRHYRRSQSQTRVAALCCYGAESSSTTRTSLPAAAAVLLVARPVRPEMVSP
jgi:hypothetical protein